MTVTRVLIVRHGETDYNATRRWQGQLDIPLNDAGREQARMLADSIHLEPIDAIFSSDLQRAWETAQIIARRTHHSIIPEPRLREVALGVFQGLTSSDIETIYPEYKHRWDLDDQFQVPGGESRKMLQARAYEAWEAITDMPELRTVLMVSHGGTMRLLLRRVLNVDASYPLHFNNTSLTIVERDVQSPWRLVTLNSRNHLGL